MKSGISRRTFIRSGGALAGSTAAALAQYRTDKSLDYAPPGDDRFQERMWKGAPEEGFALTRALECPGGSLHINARTASDGFIKVAVRQGDGVNDGDWLDDYGYDRAAEFTGDSTDHGYRWKGGADPAALKGKPIRLHFWLKKAELYSFWFV